MTDLGAAVTSLRGALEVVTLAGAIGCASVVQNPDFGLRFPRLTRGRPFENLAALGREVARLRGGAGIERAA